MTWISRLLPQSPSQHPANHNHRSRQAQRRRRMATLETLEGRTLLSNVTVSFAGGALTILGDAHNDSFSITEQSAAAGGKVTVTSTSPQTTINKTSVPFVSPQAVTSIVVRLPGTTNSDTVSLLGAGKTTPTTVKNVTITGPPRVDRGQPDLHRQWGRQQRRVHAQCRCAPHCPRGQQLVPYGGDQPGWRQQGRRRAGE